MPQHHTIIAGVIGAGVTLVAAHQMLDQRRAQRERSIETSDFRHLSDRPQYDETARQQFGTLTLTQPLSPIAYARLKQKITRENYEKLPPPKAFSLVNLTRR